MSQAVIDLEGGPALKKQKLSKSRKKHTVVEGEEFVGSIAGANEQSTLKSGKIRMPIIPPLGAMPQRYLLTVEYFGTSFMGWQKQAHARSVQGVLEEGFKMFLGQPVAVTGSSRTDTGVHALGSTCHVDITRVSKRKPNDVLAPYEPLVVKRAINHFLLVQGGEVAVTSVRSVVPTFHARFNARERTYHYRILCSMEPVSIFERNRAWHVVQPQLDLAAMRAACAVLEGNHDFSSFRGSGCQSTSAVKTLDELSVTQTVTWPPFPSAAERDHHTASAREEPVPPAAAEARDGSLERPAAASSRDVHTQPATTGALNGGNHGSDTNAGARAEAAAEVEAGDGVPGTCGSMPAAVTSYVVTARARSFLYHQVRLLVGVIKAAGCGALSTADVIRILEAGDITVLPAMAPAHGLYLSEVRYDNDSRMNEDEIDDGEEA